MKRTRRNTGFSLLELMTVVGIIGILAALSLAALEVLPQRTRLTGGALEFAAVISSARSQAYGRNQRVAVLINAATQNLGQPIRYWVVVDKWSDLAQALTDGFTTGGGLGLGLGGARRLSNDFHIESKPGEGTRVMIARWR